VTVTLFLTGVCTVLYLLTKDNPFNEDVVDKIREYRVDYAQPTSFYADPDTCVVTTDYGLGVGICCYYDFCY
jgi:hypothetical protein